MQPVEKSLMFLEIRWASDPSNRTPSLVNRSSSISVDLVACNVTDVQALRELLAANLKHLKI
jgi:hypothetical protein